MTIVGLSIKGGRLLVLTKTVSEVKKRKMLEGNAKGREI